MRFLTLIVACASLTVTVAPQVASAAEYRCQGDRVVKGGSTWFKVRKSGATIYISRSGSVKGTASKHAGKWRVSVKGATRGTFDAQRIYRKAGATWARVADAKRQFACSGPVAATLWVLTRSGAL